MENKTLCEWCASTTGAIVRKILPYLNRMTGFFGKLCKKQPAETTQKEPAPKQAEIPKTQEQNLMAPAMKRRKTTFKYTNLLAKNVKLAGDFSKWNHIQMLKDSQGNWFVTLDLAVGKYAYKFVVDNQWIKDPNNPKTQSDGYGGESSVIEIEEKK